MKVILYANSVYFEQDMATKEKSKWLSPLGWRILNATSLLYEQVSRIKIFVNN